jgi:membrane-bound lytic murein transglycosylase D
MPRSGFREISFIMKIPCTLSLMTAFLLVVITEATARPLAWSEVEETQIQTRIERMDLPVSPVYDAKVRDNIRRYVTYGYRDAEQMLGRSNRFFPIFEHYLKVNGMPESLKFLPIVESSLRPDVHSPVGAAGLWQLMSGTAQELGLRISTYVDERLDPNLSTMAALAYLKELHERFGSWELALAAYNCGPGNVRKAIRLGGSSDYYQIRQYLPRETQNYIPRFIAASYVAQYYTEHELEPEILSYDLQFTRTIRVFTGISFKKLASITGTSHQVLRQLNPSFTRNYLPTNSKGYLLVLPEMSMRAFTDYLRWSNTNDLDTDLPLLLPLEEATNDPLLVVVSPGETITKIARDYQVTEMEIRKWNGLSDTDEVYYQQGILLYVNQKPGRA